MNKKRLIYMIGIAVCILGISVPAMAETTSRRANIKSSGNLDFENGTVYFTASDLTYLADEIDNLEDTYKQTSVEALNDVGTFFLSDGTIVNDRTQNEVDTDEKKSALSFGNILEGIKKSQSVDSLSQTQVTDKDGNLLFYETEEAQANKDIHSLTTTDTGFPAFYQPANANNLSAGTAAWVDGTLIKGNGSDNAAYAEQSMVGTATTVNVLEGKTFTSSNGIGLAGAMPNKGSWISTPTSNGKVTIPEGYHNGNGYVDTSSVYTAGYNAGYSDCQLITIGTYSTSSTQQINCTNIPNYNQLTINNFVYDDISTTIHGYVNWGGVNYADSYDPKTGIYTIGQKTQTVTGASTYYHSIAVSFTLKCIPNV